ncbi:MAG TPA: Uma2 family endonuclease [Anaerolineae bacterium]
MVTKELSRIDSAATRLKMSYEEFLEWADEDTHAEWVDGEVIVFMPAKDFHQSTMGFLYTLLDLFVRLFDLGKLRLPPFEMRLEHSAREPDILFIQKENLNQLTEHRLEGPANLVVEIISDDSVQRDRRDKFKEYREAGILEYWIIDPRPGKQRADFFYLDESGDYALFATEDDDKVASKVLSGFWLRPAWLWQVDTLNPLTCALEIEGVAAALQQQIEQAGKAEAQG